MNKVEALSEAWTRLEQQWDDDRAHARFLELARSLELLGEAGRRYREVREHDPDPARRTKALEQTDRLLALAMASLEAVREPPGRARRWLPWLALAVSLALILAVVGSVLRG